jgi:hypothetical protein
VSIIIGILSSRFCHKLIKMKKFKYYILFDDGTVKGASQLVKMEDSKYFFELKNTRQKTYTTSFGNNYDVMKLIPVDIKGRGITISINHIYSLKYFVTSKMRYNAFNPVVDVCLANLVSGKDLIIPSLFEFKNDVGPLSLIDLYKRWDLSIDELLVAKPADITADINEKIECVRENLTEDFDKIMSEYRAIFWFSTAKRLRELVKDIDIESDGISDVIE